MCKFKLSSEKLIIERLFCPLRESSRLSKSSEEMNWPGSIFSVWRFSAHQYCLLSEGSLEEVYYLYRYPACPIILLTRRDHSNHAKTAP